MSKIKIFSLGGLNENGKNMYVVEVDKSLYIFDAGLKYDVEHNLGIDYIIPSFDYLIKNRKRIKGIFLSHGHEGNIGAVPDIISKLGDVPIYGGKLTLEILRLDLAEAGVKKANLHEIKAHRKLNFGKESIFPIAMTHSIPDAFCYVLYTKDGAIVYTGDFTFDHAIRSLYQTDLGKLAYVGKQGVLCLLAESLYAERPGYTSPNHRVQDFIRTILTKNENRIIVTIFPAHFYRIQELFDEISKTHRKIVIMGKSLQSMINYGIENKYLEINPKIIGDLSNLNDKDVVVFISDEREKPFANLERIIKGYDKYIKLKESDTIFISEPSAEGMERRLALIMDEIAMLGVNAISLSSKKHLLHHASSEDLKMLLNLLKPKYLFPVKGEYRNQYAFAEIAEEMNINVDEILIDGKDSSDIGNLVLKDREMLGENGIVLVSCTLDKESKEVVAGPKVLTRGFIYVKENQDIIEQIKELSKGVIESNIEKGTKRVDYAKIKSDVRDSLGKYLYQEIGSKPMIITVIQEV